MKKSTKRTLTALGLAAVTAASATVVAAAPVGAAAAKPQVCIKLTAEGSSQYLQSASMTVTVPAGHYPATGTLTKDNNQANTYQGCVSNDAWFEYWSERKRISFVHVELTAESGRWYAITNRTVVNNTDNEVLLKRTGNTVVPRTVNIPEPPPEGPSCPPSC